MRSMTDPLTLRVGCEFDYEVAADTPAVFQVEPYDAPPATVLEQGWTTKPEIALHHYVDLYGNLCQRMTLPGGTSTIGFSAVVEVPDATEEV